LTYRFAQHYFHVMPNYATTKSYAHWPLWIGLALVFVGFAACGWVLVYAMASTAAPPDMPVPFSQYLCLFGGPTASLVGIGLIVVDLIRRVRGR